MIVLKSVFLFILAALFEIGGGYLVWISFREEKSMWYTLPGAVLLMLSGVVPIFQPGNFERIYAAYGGIFVIMSLLWGLKIDHVIPDKFDLIGSFIVLVGMAIIMYYPRN